MPDVIESPVSYASPAEADTYFSRTGNSSWSVLSSEKKTFLLARATRILDRCIFWNGIRTHAENQILEWPRNGVSDTTGRMLDPETVPAFLKEASCEEALFLNAQDSESGITGAFSNVSMNGMSLALVKPEKVILPEKVLSLTAPYGRLARSFGKHGVSGTLFRG